MNWTPERPLGRRIWEAIPEEVWAEILKRVHRSFICARNGLIQCKLVHRTYYTMAWLAKIYDCVSPACDRCWQSPAKLINMFWLCPSLHNYWSLDIDFWYPIRDNWGKSRTRCSKCTGISPSLLSLPTRKMS